MAWIAFAVMALALGLLAPIFTRVSAQAQQCPLLSDKQLLSSLPDDYNRSMLWGSYRPNVYFGMRSRTGPGAVAAGIMWGFNQKGSYVLRHQCEQSDGLGKYGWDKHDGMQFGHQQIQDTTGNLEINTSFVKRPGAAGWHARISANQLNPKSTWPKGGVAIFVYLSHLDDSEAHTSQDQLDLNPSSNLWSTVSSDGFTGFRSEPTVELSESPIWFMAPQGRAQLWSTPQLRLQNVEQQIRSYLDKSPKSGNEGFPLLPPAERGEVGSRTVVLQYMIQDPGLHQFDLGLMLGPADLDTSLNLHRDMVHHGYHTAFTKHSVEFDNRSNQLFGTSSDASERRFGEYALSAVLGGMGYWHGSTIEKSGTDPSGTVTAKSVPLFSAVPCRPFFPRGFLWDEGFHQLIVSAWDPRLTVDVLSHWFELMRSDGWIPREQILGIEAITRVPQEFVAQSRGHANPPTFFLVVHKILQQSKKANTKTNKPFLEKLLPVLIKWFGWFESSQQPADGRGYMWRGRDSGDGKLNAMTLSSGLDDYPRASVPTPNERHLDMLCWLARAAGVIHDLASWLGEDQAAIEFGEKSRSLAALIVPLHWNDDEQMFHDWGHHSNTGSFEKRVVVQCDDGEGGGVQVAVDPKRDPHSQCPLSHPNFKWPLGDGRGGLLQREQYVARDTAARFVEHVGYVSLFPMMLRLLAPDAPQLPALLDALTDPQELWTRWGIRSISKKSSYYQRENAPGDAPYWRGPIWINLQYLALSGLHHYGHTEGPFQERSLTIYNKLRKNVIRNLYRVWNETNFLWEQYSDTTGAGQRAHPFNGWSSLVVLMMSEDF